MGSKGILIALLLMFPSVLFAQSGLASLSGTAHDKSGAVIPGAKVALTNTATGVSSNTLSNSAGVYVFPNVIPGQYNLTVSASGFAPTEFTSVRLSVDQSASLDVELAVGELTQKLTVNEAPPLLQTAEASVGSVVQSQQVTGLPLNGRYFTQLLELVPGAIPSQKASGLGGSFANADPNTVGKERNALPAFDVNGQSGGYTLFRLDGIENTEREFGGANIPISIDAIQEFKLQTANFSAEYGRGPAQVDVVTKSGTNELHGVLFEFLRNDDLDATQWSYSGPHTKKLLKRNQFGGAVGGPIKKDKLFWFFNYDGTREVYSSPETVTVPTQAMRNGVFPAGEVIWDWTAQGQFLNNTIPQSRLSPTMQQVLSVIPQPNLPGVAVTNASGLALPPTNNYFYDPRHTQTINQFSGRIDYTISSKDTIAGRYTFSGNTEIGDGPLATNLNGSIVGFERAVLGGSNMSLGWFHTFTPSTINEARFGFLTDPQDYAKGDTTDYAKEFGLSQFLFPGYFPGLPHFQITNSTGALNVGSGDNRPLQVGEKNFEWVDNLTMVHGKHTIKIGADIRKTNLLTNNSEISSGQFYFNGAQTRNRNQPNSSTTNCPGANNPTGCTNGDGVADFLLGYLSFSGEGTPVLQKHKFFSTWAGYINDTWRVTSKLTASMGLRYDYTTRWHADPAQYAEQIITNGQLSGVAVADPGGNLSSAIQPGALQLIPNQVVGCSTVGLPAQTCLVSDKTGIQPRLGLAYQVTPKTVIRAAAGIFYGQLYGDFDTEDGESFPFTVNNSTLTYTAPPAGNAPPPLTIANPRATTIVPTPQLLSSLPGRRVPHTYQFNFTVEREITRNTIVQVGYVGVLGRDQENNFEYCCRYNIQQPWGVVLAPGQVQKTPDPAFATNSLMFEDNVSSNYHALDTKVERRFSAGVSFVATYTWSKNLGTIPWEVDPRYPEQQPLNNDLRNSFVLSPIWEIPVGNGRRFLNQKGLVNEILGGWQVSTIVTWHSGFPFTPTLSGVNTLLINGVSVMNTPDAICSGAVTNPTPENWYNKSCFVAPTEPTTPGAPLHQGDLGLNTLRGPSNFGMDLGVSKNFLLTERFNLDFRFEAFNFLNHPMLNLPDTNIVPGNNAPAAITSTLSNPRTLQFALKLHF